MFSLEVFEQKLSKILYLTQYFLTAHAIFFHDLFSKLKILCEKVCNCWSYLFPLNRVVRVQFILFKLSSSFLFHNHLQFRASQKLCKTEHAYITLGSLSSGMSIGRCKILHLALSFPNSHWMVFWVLLSIWLKTTSSYVEQCSYSFITYGNKGYAGSAKNNCGIQSDPDKISLQNRLNFSEE